jgi:NAD(P)-dependent dehydrogenase (short-subunit alcohol dehydrogenase family)
MYWLYGMTMEVGMASSDVVSKLKTVVVTGASDGLGRATALMLAANGYRVFAGGRNAAKLASVQDEATQRKLTLTTLEMDVTSDESVNRAIATVQNAAGTIDILVNNAGIAIIAPMETISLADLHRQYETNIFGVVRVTQRVLPGMRAQGRGRIVNMSSIGGKVASPLFGAYSSSKFALESISDAWRRELNQFGIQVILIEPGIIPSGMASAARELSAAYIESEPGPYGPMKAGFERTWSKESGKAKTTPDDCARVILNALRAARPKARYPVTPTATVMSYLLRVLTDRTLDRMILGQYNLPKPK